MKKIIYNGKTKSFNTLKDISDLVTEKTGQASCLMEEVYHHPYGVTLDFYYWLNEEDNHMTKITAFGDEDHISQIEKALTSPKCTLGKGIMINPKG